MEQRVLGRTGLKVSTLCLGGGMYGTPWGNPDVDESIDVIHAALDAGLNFVDTADVYGESEVVIGKALKGRRDDIILTSKFNNPLGGDPKTGGNSKRWIMKACERSLRRLGTDYIDIYQVHRPDPDTDIDETLSALNDLIRQGKVRHIGTSTFSAAEIVEAEWTAQRRNRERFVTTQAPYSLLYREIETSLLPTCQRHGIGALAFSPLHGGMLSDTWAAGSDEMTNKRAAYTAGKYDLSRAENRPKREALSALTELARQNDMSLIHLALAFVLVHPAVTSAIIGAGTVHQLESQIGAAQRVLPAGLLDAIDEIVPPGMSFFPDDFNYTPPALTVPALRRRSPAANVR